MATEGGNVPTFCQDGAQDFYKINEKLIGIGLVASLEKSRGHGHKIFIYAPNFYNHGCTLGLIDNFFGS